MTSPRCRGNGHICLRRVQGCTVGAVFAQAGIMASPVRFGMIIAAISLGTLAERLGRPRTVAVCIGLFGFFTAPAGLTDDPVRFSTTRFIAGPEIGGVMPTSRLRWPSLTGQGVARLVSLGFRKRHRPHPGGSSRPEADRGPRMGVGPLHRAHAGPAHAPPARDHAELNAVPHRAEQGWRAVRDRPAALPELPTPRCQIFVVPP